MSHSLSPDLSVYPWHEDIWSQFTRTLQQKRLPHALLLHGMAGLGKKTLASHMAAHLLCETADTLKISCGRCFSCQQDMISEHPDCILLEPEGESRQIKIDKVRELFIALEQTTVRLKNRVILIMPAEALNLSSVNALLKRLEEPPPNTYFILVSDQPQQLPATLRSRCQAWEIKSSFSDSTVNWLSTHLDLPQAQCTRLLEQADGCPHAAKACYEEEKMSKDIWQTLAEIHRHPEKTLFHAKKWHEDGLDKRLKTLMMISAEQIKKRLRQPTGNDIPDPHEWINAISLETWTAYQQALLDIYKSWVITPNLNTHLLSETILLRWIMLMHPA